MMGPFGFRFGNEVLVRFDYVKEFARVVQDFHPQQLNIAIAPQTLTDKPKCRQQVPGLGSFDTYLGEVKGLTFPALHNFSNSKLTHTLAMRNAQIFVSNLNLGPNVVEPRDGIYNSKQI